MKICPYCNEPASGIACGDDDYLDFCKTCDKLIEGQTREISDKEYERLHG